MSQRNVDDDEEYRQLHEAIYVLRDELERLVKQWRERAFVDFHSSSRTASKRGKDCADDLEAVLRRTAEDEDGV